MSLLSLLLAVSAMILLRVRGNEDHQSTIQVSSLPNVAGYLANPCHLLNQNAATPSLSLSVRQQIIQVALTNIIFANTSLLGIQGILGGNCNVPFSLQSLPALPNPFNTTHPNGEVMLHRDLLYFAAHLYFALNYTQPATSHCMHETSEFVLHLNQLTGMIENLLCRLIVLSGNTTLLTPAVAEVSALRLMDSSTCAGRRLWMCILVGRIRTGLAILKRFLGLPSNQGNAIVNVVGKRHHGNYKYWITGNSSPYLTHLTCIITKSCHKYWPDHKKRQLNLSFLYVTS